MKILQRPAWLAGAVLVSSAILVGLAAAWQARDNEATARLRFEPIGQRTVSEVAERMARVEYGLKGLQGAATVFGPTRFDRAELQRYIATRDMAREFPGVLSMGYIRRVAATDEGTFAADANRRTDFEIVQLGSNTGERYLIVGSVLANGVESAVIGLDIASEPARRAAATAAMRSGRATMTSPITLRSAGSPGSSYLLLLPVYRTGAMTTTEEERASANVAWAYTSLAVDAVLEGVDRPDDQISVAIRDVSGSAAPTVFATTSAGSPSPVLPKVTAVVPMFGRSWEVDVRAEPAFVDRLAQRRPRDVVTVGLLLAALLAALAWLEARRAARVAKICADHARAAAIVESSTDAVIGESLDGLVTDWNEGAVRLFGYPAENAVGRPLAGLLLPEGREGEDLAIRTAIRGGTRIAPFETSRHASDGRLIDVSITASPIRAAGGQCVGFSITVRDISEARRAQRALATLNGTLEQQVAERVAQLDTAQRESTALLRSLDQLAIVSVTDRTGRITEVNDNFCRISGYGRGEAIGRNHRLVNSGVQSDAFWTGMWRSVAGGHAWRGEICNRAKDGSLYWVDCSIAPFVDADGVIENFVSIMTDITARKRVEQELLLTNERFANAADSAKMGVWEYAIGAGTLVWDHRMYAIYGREPTRGALPVSVWHDCLHPDDRERSLRELQDAIDGGRPFDTFFRIVRPDGTIRHLKAAAHVSRDSDGVALRAAGVNIDLTERVDAEEAQAASEALLRRVGRLADVGGWLIDLRNETVQWTEQTRLIHEVPDDFEPTLENAIAFYDADRREVVAEAVRRGTSSGEGWDFELPFTTFTGRRIWVHSIGEAEFENGKPVRLVGAFQDITARRKAADLLRQATFKAEAANRAKSLFLANMSHEIRTPMNAVIGLSYLMECTPLNAGQTDTMAKLNLASRALMAIIDNVLDLSKIEASEMRIEQAPFSLRNLLSNLSSLLAPQAETRGIDFEIDAADDLPPMVRGDATRVQQVLTNLLSNAIKFTEKGGVRLTVRTVGASPAGSIRLRFVAHDSGIGIEADALDGLFKPFAQADTSTTRRFGGTGLGLSIVKQLVTLMGGELGASSTVRKGSEFWVELAFQVDDAKPPAGLVDAEDVRSDTGLSGVRILVVDDSAINLEVARRVLEGAGADVRVAHDGQEAIDGLLASPGAVDVVLMDVQMPVLDGLNATRRIRANPLLARLPVIALTAGSLTSEQHEAEAAGVDAFISKPLDPQKLIRCIRRFAQADDAGPLVLSAAVAPAGWPAVHGIDSIVASRCLGGNVRLFRAMLGRLLDEFADLGTRPATEATALLPLAHRLHKLAGSSGTLGATALMRICIDGESACRAGETERAAALTMLAGERLRRLRLAVVAMSDCAEAVSMTDGGTAVEAGADDLAELIRLLRELNLNAPDRFAAMAPQLRRSLGEVGYASMRGQIDRLQFADAADALTALQD